MFPAMETTVTHSDVAFATLADEMVAARGALLELVNEDPKRWWQAYNLKTRARSDLSAGAVSLALNRLIDDGTLDVAGDAVRLSG